MIGGGYFWIFLEIYQKEKKYYFFCPRKNLILEDSRRLLPKIETIISTVPLTVLIYSDQRPLYILLYSLHRFVKI